MAEKLTCEVCGTEQAVGVACVPGIPYSAAYGRECLLRGAQPYHIVRANVACCGGLAYMMEWYGETVVYVDGQYTTLRVALGREPLRAAELAEPQEVRQ
jgi:hypothetical protein